MASRPRVGAGSRIGARQTTRAPAAKHPPPSAARAADRAGAELSALGATAGTKRKERDFEVEDGDQETNIHVVVRCRGRTEREIAENSGVAVNTDGVKGKHIELSNIANGLSNKTYNFDRAYSQAADQSMVFDDTVKPILDDMLAGYNCTIFAYGQTGTGKTYTMTGDMSDPMGMLSDEAGIVPRLLQQLFNKLEIESMENSVVKCSFIELYDEELRDLLSTDDGGAELKIYQDTSRKGHASTVVHNMEEKHIGNASEGIKVVREGSLKRHVAATNYNDLSSRSHTIFTITTYIKKTDETGAEDLVTAGKLNLVDLAGSENIQRSGAENKRAAEAGKINKSLLTLGRVINALVDHSPHIPYRESKLTRLLQDSLGGRTKTCIIATISPAKSNLEETMSTLNYAFRAKNIRNKPQFRTIPTNTLLKDFTSEIERLKTELACTRQRNGVYLPNEVYEEITAQNESQKTTLEDQRARTETLETNLRSKSQELFSLISSFTGMKKEHEGTKAQLNKTEDALKVVTETKGELLGKLYQAENDITALHAKNNRKSDLDSVNRATWGTSQSQVADVTSMVERRVLGLQGEQQKHISSISTRMEAFVAAELKKLSSAQSFLHDLHAQAEASQKQLLLRNEQSEDSLDGMPEKIKGLHDTMEDLMRDGLKDVSQIADEITGDLSRFLENFHEHTNKIYQSLGGDFDSLFQDIARHITTQLDKSESLRRQLRDATGSTICQNADFTESMQEALEKEHRQAIEDREKLMAEICSLVSQQAEKQEIRLKDRDARISRRLAESSLSIEEAVSQYDQDMDAWGAKEREHLREVDTSGEQIKSKLREEVDVANSYNNSIRTVAKGVDTRLLRVVEERAGGFGTQIENLGGFAKRVESGNANKDKMHAQVVAGMKSALEESYENMSSRMKGSSERIQHLGDETELDTKELRGGIEPLETELCQPLSKLREGISSASLQEYQATGATPRRTSYEYAAALPRAEANRILVSGDKEPSQLAAEEAAEQENEDGREDESSPTRSETESPDAPDESHLGSNLRETNGNIMSRRTEDATPSFKHSTRPARGTRNQGTPPTAPARSMSRRKSSRLGK